MTKNHVVLVGAVLGLIVPMIVLTILWFGLGFGITVGSINLTNLLWPSSTMLIRGWHSTVPGVRITASSIAINCLLYVAIALVLRACINFITKLKVIRE